MLHATQDACVKSVVENKVLHVLRECALLYRVSKLIDSATTTVVISFAQS